jgi:hypothetical protein
MIGKVAVMGVLQRHGSDGSQVRCEVISNRRKHHLEQSVAENVTAGATLYTDSRKSYDQMEQRG